MRWGGGKPWFLVFADVCGANTSTMADVSSHHNVTHGRLRREAQNHSQSGVSGSSKPLPPPNERGCPIFLNNSNMLLSKCFHYFNSFILFVHLLWSLPSLWDSKFHDSKDLVSYLCWPTPHLAQDQESCTLMPGGMGTENPVLRLWTGLWSSWERKSQTARSTTTSH